MRPRPIGRLAREIEDARAPARLGTMAREVALRTARSFPGLSVDQARDLFALAAEIVTAADDVASAESEHEPDPRAVRAGHAANVAKRMAALACGKPKERRKPGLPKKAPGLLEGVARMRRENPRVQQRELYETLKPAVAWGTFRKNYWRQALEAE